MDDILQTCDLFPNLEGEVVVLLDLPLYFRELEAALSSLRTTKLIRKRISQQAHKVKYVIK